MKGRRVVLGHSGDQAVAALMVDGRLDDLLIDPVHDNVPLPGAIYRAICDRPVKGQGGMMVRLPMGNGFLRGAKGLRPGQPVLVQVTSYAEPGKAPPVTGRILFKSRYAIATPDAPGINISRAIKDEEARVRLMDIAHSVVDPKGPTGLILRSVAQDAPDQEIEQDIAVMADLAAAVFGDQNGDKPELLVEGADAHMQAWREWGDVGDVADGPSALNDHDIPDLIEELRSPRVELAGGAYAFIEPTRALIAIDVNTGRDMSQAAGLKANIALARDLPRQLRCRGLGGQITVDFAPTAKKDRRQLEQVLKSALRADTVETSLVGWTTLGHFEMQRKRERLPLTETMPR